MKPYSIFCRAPAADAVQFISTALPTRSGYGGDERAADHAAPGVADEVRAFDAEAVEQVDDGARTLLERERRRELLAFAVSGRVDEDHPVRGAEVLGLRRPHVAGHQQAGPEHDRVSAAAVRTPIRPSTVSTVLFHQIRR